MPNKPYARGACTGDGCTNTISLYPGRKGSMCRHCTGRAMCRTEGHREAARASMKRRWQDPAAAKKLVIGMVKAARRPERREQLRQAGIASGPDRARYVNTPAGSPARKLANKRMVDTKLSWCPDDYRELYSHLRKVKEIPAPVAKQMVLEQVEIDRQRLASERAAGTRSFEAQLEAVRNGAGITPTFKPSKVMPDVTLGGVATGMLG